MAAQVIFGILNPFLGADVLFFVAVWGTFVCCAGTGGRLDVGSGGKFVAAAGTGGNAAGGGGSGAEVSGRGKCFSMGSQPFSSLCHTCTPAPYVPLFTSCSSSS